MYGAQNVICAMAKSDIDILILNDIKCKLLGVTGLGKTFTMANVIQALQKPTLVIAHNKTLAAQLYGEFKEMFPENAVEYFVSYYAERFWGTIYSNMVDKKYNI